MPDDFLSRLRAARRELAAHLDVDRVGNQEIAERVARAEGREKPYADSWVTGVWNGGIVPNRNQLIAIARVCGVRVGWLVEGEEPMKSAPPRDETARGERDAEPWNHAPKAGPPKPAKGPGKGKRPRKRRPA